MIKRLLLLSFLEGAAVMVAELCGAKMLSPVFGGSLYVWASVLGITLAALALGYFWGGRLSAGDKNQVKRLSYVLVAASCLLVTMPVVSSLIVPALSYLPFQPAVVTSSFFLIVPPMFFLGASSPLFIQVQSLNGIAAGTASGTTYAVSTAGGIFSTFLCGFYLIPVLGLNLCLILTGLVLASATLFITRTRSLTAIGVFVACAFLSVNAHSRESRDLFTSHSVNGLLEVRDVQRGSDSVRILMVNRIIQTEMSLQTGRSVSPYIDLLDSLIPPASRRKQALVLGLGGGLLARMLESKNYEVTGVEFDRRIIEVAEKYFRLPASVGPVNADARYFINRNKEVFDLVVFDVFKAEEQPSHVLTRESISSLKSFLGDSALIVVNWHGYRKGKAGTGTSILLNTLETSGFNISLFPTPGSEHHRNILVLARAGKGRSEDRGDALINTDDRQMLERYNARANRSWRENYLRYYQSAR